MNSSLISSPAMKRSSWQTAVIFVLAFWLSSSLLIDFLVMPSLYATGMMSQPGFAAAGYVLFWLFNRVEVLCAATALTGLLALRINQDSHHRKGWIALALAGVLLAIALIYTYGLTPHMSALGLQLDLFNQVVEVPATMNQLHSSYWILEVLKFATGGWLLNLCYRDRV